MPTLTNKQRHEKLKQAEALIREVEFSYEDGNETRRMLYRFVVNTFSFTGVLSGLITGLRDEVRKEENNPYYL